MRAKKEVNLIYQHGFSYASGFCLQVQDKNSELLGTFLASSEKPGRWDRVYGDPTELDPRLINTPVYVTVVDCTGNSITEKKQCTILYSASGCGKEEASKLATEVSHVVPLIK